MPKPETPPTDKTKPADKPAPESKPYGAAHLAALGSVSAFAVVVVTLEKFLDVGERLVKAVDRNAAATEKLASTVTSDKLPSGEQGAPYVRVGGVVLAKKF